MNISPMTFSMSYKKKCDKQFDNFFLQILKNSTAGAKVSELTTQCQKYLQKKDVSYIRHCLLSMTNVSLDKVSKIS